MRQTRYEQLSYAMAFHTAEEIRDLALAEQARTGRPVIYKTIHTIARTLGVHQLLVADALRLAYTSEFLDENGFGFVDQGNGRSGAIYGYVLVQDGTAADREMFTHMVDAGAKQLDHLRGAAGYVKQLAAASGKNTKQHKAYMRLYYQVVGVNAGLEGVVEEIEALSG